MKHRGCYAAAGPLALHWRKVTEGQAGGSWSEFTKQVAALPAGQLWRHNQAGDLPGVADEIDVDALAELVAANKGRNGFSYSHKPVVGRSRVARRNHQAIADANDAGFTINLSGNTLAHADELADTGAGPVVVVLARISHKSQVHRGSE